MSSSLRVLALDLATGGVTASLIGTDLAPISTAEAGWSFVHDSDGAETLSAETALSATAAAVRKCMASHAAPDALVLSAMMHTLVIVSRDLAPRSPVFTWNDRRDGAFRTSIHARLGDYRGRTGCHFHPSFPAFKLAWMARAGSDALDGDFRVASLKGYLQAALTGNGAEDTSTASASGLTNLLSGDWDPETIDVLGLGRDSLPSIIEPHEVAGALTTDAARRTGLPPGIPVVAGAGDGFFATSGSGCESPAHAAGTLGTTVSVRRFIPAPDDTIDPGTFCYRYGEGRYLSGCAGNNGGNVLEWMNAALGPIRDSDPTRSPPVFLPFLNGERAPFWDSTLRPRWIGVNGSSLVQLRAAVVESLAFELAVYLELTVGNPSSVEAVILSGNGFDHAPIAPLLAALVPAPVRMSADAGFATLRGAARCGFEALGRDTQNAAGRLLRESATIEPSLTPGLEDRYGTFRELYQKRRP